MSCVQVGTPIPLSLQVYDNRPDLKVRADIYSPSGDKYGNIYLYHKETGLYLNTEIPMPDIRHVIVVYQVEDSGEYESVSERFDSSQPDAEPEEYIHGAVETVTQSSEFIIGVVDEIASS